MTCTVFGRVLHAVIKNILRSHDFDDVLSQLTPDEVCAKHGVNNITIDYTEENYRQWTSYKLYADHVRPMVLKENPKVSMTRLVQLIAAKWREFDSQNPYREQSHSSAKKNKEGRWKKLKCVCSV